MGTKKLKNSKGFTFVEMICVVAVIALFSLCIVIGIDMCMDTFQSTVGFANAQTLSSTVTTLISDELRFATRIQTSEEGSGDPKLTSYFSQNYGAGAKIRVKSITGRGKHTVKALYVNEEQVLGKSAYTGDCSIEGLDIRYNKENKTFTVDFSIQNFKGETLDTVHCQVKCLRS